MAVEDKVEAPLSKSVNAPLSKTFAGYDPDEVMSGAYDALSKSLANRTAKPAQMFDPTLLAMAQGFLAPTPTGSFGESLGAVSKNVGEVQRQQQKDWEDEQKRIQDNAMMRLTLGRDMKSARTEQNIQDQMSGLYTQDEDGKYVLNPKAAQNLASLTKDPKYAELLVADQRKRQVKAVADEMFTQDPLTKKFTFNQDAIYKLARISDNPIEDLGKYAQLIPNMRKAGMINGLLDEATPFDALVLTASDPMIRQQATLMQQKYAKGLIDPDKADALAKDLMTASMAHMDKKEQRDMIQAQNATTNLLAQQSIGARNESARERADLAREKFDEAKKQNEGKLTDTQKMQYKQIILPLINEGIKSVSALSDVQSLKKYIEKAPSGLPSAAISGTIGRVWGTDENTAMREIETLQKKMITSIPRLPGSASNLDAKNLEASIGKLNDWTLTKKQRQDIVGEIESGFKKLQDRGQVAEDYWETNRAIHPSIMGKDTPAAPANQARPTGQAKTVVRTGTIQSGADKGKRVTLYSDGTQEIK